MSVCVLCGKEAKKEIFCKVTNGNICMLCCFSVSSGDVMMNKLRKEKGLPKEDILAQCSACLQEKIKK